VLIKLERENPNIADEIQSDYVSAYTGFPETLKKYKAYFENRLITRPPYSSTTDTFYHALRYAFGLKDYKREEQQTAQNLRPHWDDDGRARTPHTGKYYVSMHPLDDYDVNGD
jgi:hypothetical protein